MTAATVVGYGSIGRRHARLLRQLGCTVAVVSRRTVDYQPSFRSLAEAVRDFHPDYVVIATETSAHAAAVDDLVHSGFSGRILIEKPLAVTGAALSRFDVAAVGYNLRFHPVMAALAEEIQGEPLISIDAYGGQYLPDWRPDTDYRRSYSADPARGGGALRDLSHELDYVLWLGGGWRRVAALGGRFGPLEIDADDCWGLLLELERCKLAAVQVNYYDRPGRRQLVVNTARHTYLADMVRGLLCRDGEERSFSAERDAMYLEQHRAVLAGDASRLCSVQQGERVMALIAAAERAAAQRVWIAA
jgi:predicted dehydrogenase